MKQKAKRLYKYEGSEVLADNLAVCSCPMCGHIREHEGPPIREKRQPNIDDFSNDF